MTTVSGSDVIPFEEYEGSSAVLTDVSSLVDGHAYIVLLKVEKLVSVTKRCRVQRCTCLYDYGSADMAMDQLNAIVSVL